MKQWDSILLQLYKYNEEDVFVSFFVFFRCNDIMETEDELIKNKPHYSVTSVSENLLLNVCWWFAARIWRRRKTQLLINDNKTLRNLVFESNTWTKTTSDWLISANRSIHLPNHIRIILAMLTNFSTKFPLYPFRGIAAMTYCHDLLFSSFFFICIIVNWSCLNIPTTVYVKTANKLNCCKNLHQYIHIFSKPEKIRTKRTLCDIKEEGKNKRRLLKVWVFKLNTNYLLYWTKRNSKANRKF